MRIATLRIPLVLCLLALNGLAHADEKAVRSVLTANYAKFAEAFRKNDIETMSKFLAQDYIAIPSEGQKISRDAMITALRQQRAAMLTVTMENKIHKLTLKGSEAIVILFARTSGTIADPKGGHHKLVADATSKDTWIKTKSGWKIKSDETQKATVMMDGKPMDLSGIGK